MQAFRIERLRALVGGGERGVDRWMPVLGDDDVLEPASQPVDERDDLVAAIDRQRSARHEIGLQVDRQKNVLAH